MRQLYATKICYANMRDCHEPTKAVNAKTVE